MKFFVVYLFVFSACSIHQVENTTSIKASSKGNLMFIRLEVNDKNGVFLIDTGAGISLLDTAQSNNYNFKYHPGTNVGTVSGIGGSSSFTTLSKINVGYKKRLLKGTKFYGSNFSAINRYFDQWNFKILGILGADFFDRTNATINFRDLLITIPDKSLKARVIPCFRNRVFDLGVSSNLLPSLLSKTYSP